MTRKNHIVLITVVAFTWLGFLLIGIPTEYYLDSLVETKILLSLLTFFAMVPFIGFFTMMFLNGNYFHISLWFAFYASVLIFILDFIYVSLVLSHGIDFLFSHWPQSIAYVYVWINLPLVGIAMNRIQWKSKY